MWKNTGQNKLVGSKPRIKMAACDKKIKIENIRKSEDSKKVSTETNDNGWRRG